MIFFAQKYGQLRTRLACPRVHLSVALKTTGSSYSD
jgi:hypothetical protein